MLEDLLPSIWASVYGWFTPTVLFVLLNLMIGTIFFTSGFGTQKNQAMEGKQPPLTRAPSVLERLKSINLYRYRSGEINPFPSVTTTVQPAEPLTYQTMEQEQPGHEEEEETLDHHLEHGDEKQVDDHHVKRSMSDTKPASGDIPVKLPQKMKKSASSKSAFGHFEEEEIVDRRRPSTVKERKSRANELQHFGEDDEVDAKADDFINRFKQQLKLQRLDSIIRYKEMLTRGAK
ncbi:pathogen-associated molecular patterns-induced protein A70-like [Macadamia integrifolia]|uniref:pathogen-associated molecular patterns-induced protein A70-like n=1 Tax=Macadamia integrifolia TaxID=60698 RepID=UPI001C52EC9D|nr:pathogen-associated molecular patterns-induced protein A70-like [Macadamia integrifolia]